MRIGFNTLHEDPRAPSNAVRFIANMVTALADAAPENEYVLYVGEAGAAMYDEVTAPMVSRRVLPHLERAATAAHARRADAAPDPAPR